MNIDELIKIAVDSMNKAITFKSKVGAAILTKDGSVFTGFNIETRIHKGYHAEEVALISFLKAGYKRGDIKAIAIAYSFEGTYPACASCRQYLWELGGEDMEVACYDLTNNKGSIFKLIDLYPMPYPIEQKELLKVPELVTKKNKTSGSNINIT